MKYYEQPSLIIRMYEMSDRVCNGSNADPEDGLDWNEGNDMQGGV